MPCEGTQGLRTPIWTAISTLSGSRVAPFLGARSPSIERPAGRPGPYASVRRLMQLRASVSRVDWTARAVVALSSGWFLFTAAWGLFEIPASGHLGAGSAATIMATEPMLQYHTVYPSWAWYTGAPTKAQYICHHPFGTFYFSALFLWIFGQHDFVVHLPTVLLSAAIPPLLYGIAREHWGEPVGAVAAAAYVVVPIAVGFSGYTNLETITIFGALLFFWGHSRHMASGAPRHLVASLAGLAFACSGDWAGYLLVAPLLLWAFVRACVLPSRWTPSLRLGTYLRWWGLSVGVALGELVLWLGLFYYADQIAAWLSQGVARGGGAGVPLEAVLASRKNWIDFSFIPLAVFLGKLAAPVCLLRLVLLRRDEETYALSLLLGAVVQYVVFKNGADIHIFWPHYFAPYYALALAQLVHTIVVAVRWSMARLVPARAGTIAGVVGLTVGLLPSVAMAHDGVLSLWVWRRTGGRYDDNGHFIPSAVDMHSVVRQVVLPRTQRGTGMDAHDSAGWGWDHVWTLHAQAAPAGMPVAGNAGVVHPFWIARGSGLTSDLEKKIAAVAHVQVYGDVWLVDQRDPVAPLDAYSVEEREPNPFEWLLRGGTEPVRTMGSQPDPWLTWEWRTHLGQTAPLPGGEPETIDQIRIAHNAAVQGGDEAQAGRFRRAIDTQLDRTVTARFEQGISLIGVRVIGGVQPRIESWFQVTAPIGELMFDVRSTILSTGRWSLIPPDTTDRAMAIPPPLATKSWRPGFIYKTTTVMNHRIGREQYAARWISRDGSPAPARIDGSLPVTLTIAE